MASAKYVKKLDYGEPFHIDQESDSKIPFARKQTRREKCLFAAVAVFVIVAIVFIVLYAKQVSKNGETASSGSTAANEGATNDTTNAPTNPATNASCKTTVCLEPHCVLIASG